MSILATVHTGLYAFGAFWSLVTFAVAAAAVSKFNADLALVGVSAVMASNFTAANAILATGVLGFVYFIAALVVLLFVSSESFLVSVIMDTICLGFLFVLGLGSAAALSTEASYFSFYSEFTEAQLGSATIGLGWILTFLFLGILIFEVTVTLLHYGTSYPTWRSSFHDLVHFGGRRGVTTTAATEKPAESATAPTVNPADAAPVATPATAPTASTEVPTATV